jgi:hypothetical protein
LRRGSIDLQQRDIALSVDCEHAFDRKDCSCRRVNFGAMGAFEDVTVSDDAIRFDEEAAASRKLLAAAVKSFYCNRGGLNTSNEFGEKILRGSNGGNEGEQ